MAQFHEPDGESPGTRGLAAKGHYDSVPRPATVGHDVTSSEKQSDLENLTPGAVVVGLRPDGPVTVVAAVWNGSSCVTLTYRTATGEVAELAPYVGAFSERAAGRNIHAA